MIISTDTEKLFSALTHQNFLWIRNRTEFPWFDKLLSYLMVKDWILSHFNITNKARCHRQCKDIRKINKGHTDWKDRNMKSSPFADDMECLSKIFKIICKKPPRTTMWVL